MSNAKSYFIEIYIKNVQFDWIKSEEDFKDKANVSD